MSALELVQVLTSSGVLAGGLGLLKWGLATERRLLKLELKNGIEK
ncbi:MAG: hypothetical protein WCC39_13275 [Telluria sp.]|jgi:hypothetical protein